MEMNQKFREKVNSSGLTMYTLAKRTGVPYTTINELMHGKTDINQCAAASVWKLSEALGAEMGEIMNDIRFLDGVKGRYKGIDYVWKSDDSSRIIFEYSGSSQGPHLQFSPIAPSRSCFFR